MSIPLSGSQTVGPFFSIGLSPLCGNRVPSLDAGVPVRIEGLLLDSQRLSIPDAFLEIWCADSRGRYGRYPTDAPLLATECPGFARISTNTNGSFSFTVVKPGPVRYDAERIQAPHLLVLIFMRGLLRNLVTRMYFPDEATNATDPILQLVPEHRRQTLVPELTPSGSLEWTIVTKGEDETAFFAW